MYFVVAKDPTSFAVKGSFSYTKRKSLLLPSPYHPKIVLGRYPTPSFNTNLLRSNFDPRVQRVLLPHHEDFLHLPWSIRVRRLKVELPQKIGEDQSQFQVREIAAEAVPRPNGERVEWGAWRA